MTLIDLEVHQDSRGTRRMGGKAPAKTPTRRGERRTTKRRPRKKPTLPTEASKLKMLQADLQQSQQEINRLLERLSDVNREKSEMVSNDVHTELMRMADERAKRAELRAMALEHELRAIKQQFNNSHNELDMYPMVKVFPNKSEKSNKSSLPDRYQIHEYPPMVPPRGGFDYTQSNSTYVQGNRPRNQSSPASPHMFRKNNGHDPDLDRSRPTNRTAGKTAKDKVRSQSKSPKRTQRITTRMSRAHSQGVADVKNKTTLFSRVQSKMDTGSKSSPKSNHKTFLDRVQSKFFASKKKDAVTPCDLPDINTLMQYSMKAEYETPLEYMKNYTGTPLIDNANNTKLNRSVAESESDWSETDDELLEPGIKKAKRDKHLQKKHKKDKARANKEAERSSQEAERSSQGAEARKEDSNDENDSQSGSQKSKSSKTGPPVAPKPKKSSNTNTSSESLNSTGSQSKTNSTDATSQEKTVSTESLEAPPVAPSSPGREAPVSFEESAPEKPQLKSYRRLQGPRGRRPPTRYSSHALSQTMSTTLSQIMA